MRKLVVLSVLVAFIVFPACDKDTGPGLDDLSLKTKTLIESDNGFGFDLIKLVNEQEDESSNICVSPLSISLALAMTYNGASGDTRVAMQEALGLRDFTREEVNQLYRDLLLALRSDDPKVKFEVANSIWYRDEYDILDDFVERNEVYYDAMVQALDFNDPGAKDIINGWVADKTHDKIESIVDQITPESFMFLINALYFKGTWKMEFDEKETRDHPFRLDNGAMVEVPTMSMEADLNILEAEKFSAVELPYGKGNWAMFVLLPKEEFNTDVIINELNSEAWEAHLSGFAESREVKLRLPKWKAEFEASLADVLKAMGMEIAFTSAADFSGILPGAPLQISDVKHKTFIEVNEEGTEAAAVTSVEIELTSINNKNFFVDRPFVYLISEKSSGSVLFIGEVQNPEN